MLDPNVIIDIAYIAYLNYLEMDCTFNGSENLA